jgi:cytoskeletal protein CcmA (bactofilin family)
MTHIGPAVSIVGDVECDDDDLLVDGHVRGRVRSRTIAIVIGRQGRIQGDIRGRQVVVHGRVDGSIWASERIELGATAVVQGSLSANRIVIPDGAIVNGRVDMDQRTIAAAVARFKAEQPGVVA